MLTHASKTGTAVNSEFRNVFTECLPLDIQSACSQKIVHIGREGAVAAEGSRGAAALGRVSVIKPSELREGCCLRKGQANIGGSAGRAGPALAHEARLTQRTADQCGGGGSLRIEAPRRPHTCPRTFPCSPSMPEAFPVATVHKVTFSILS
jgi:hypothetical protein